MPLSKRLSDTRGFTLVEVLVVVLILGLLAAIAIPMLVGERDRGHDADAKSNVQNAVTDMEACYIERDRSYAGCDLLDSGLPVGTAAGQVGVVVSADGERFTVAAPSQSGIVWKVTSAGSGLVRCTADAVAGDCADGDGRW